MSRLRYAANVLDTKRLDWLLGHPGAVLDFHVEDGTPGKHYIRWFSESKNYVVYGANFRECIDNAIAGKAEIF